MREACAPAFENQNSTNLAEREALNSFSWSFKMRYSVRDIPSWSFARHCWFRSRTFFLPCADYSLFFFLIFFSRRVARLHNRVADTGEFLTAAHAYQPRAPISRASGFLSLSVQTFSVTFNARTFLRRLPLPALHTCLLLSLIPPPKISACKNFSYMTPYKLSSSFRKTFNSSFDHFPSI